MAGSMADMVDKMGMDAGLSMRFPIGLLIILPQTELQIKRIVDLDEGLCFCNRTLKIPPFLSCLLLRMQIGIKRSGQASTLSLKDLVK
jgi:hypothetical protein